MPRKPSLQSEVVIVGGGLVGLTAAAALASIDVECVIIESGNFKQKLQAEDDGRSSAIAYGSKQFLNMIGMWDALADEAGPILDIRITDSDSPLFLHYDHKLVGKEPMGYMLSNNVMWQRLYRHVSTHKYVTLIDDVTYSDIQNDSAQSQITLSDGREIKSSLLLAADGKFSSVRKYFGIESKGWKYTQSGIVCNIRHEKHHEGIAQERFLTSGPFAILPLKGGYESSLVWTEKTHLAPLYAQMSEEEITHEISKRFGDYLGKLSVSSKIYTYPLSLSNAATYIAKRMALVGDAAHAIHPIAGQGFNLGIRDIEALLPILKEAKSLGADVGSDAILEAYADSRKFDTASLIVITDLLNRLFSNDIMPLKHARRLGMAAVNKMPKLKKFFMQHAMGVSGSSS